MFLNVFNAMFPVLHMTTQDANTEISKVFVLFCPPPTPSITDLKAVTQNLGFVQVSRVLIWEN